MTPVDTLRLLLWVVVTAASVDDAAAAPQLFRQLTPQAMPRLEVVWADGKYHNHQLEADLKFRQTTWRLEVVSRPPGQRGFTLLPRRWVAERTIAWIGRFRRHSKDYERRCDSSEAMIQISAIHHMLKRLAPPPTPARFNYRTGTLADECPEISTG